MVDAWDVYGQPGSPNTLLTVPTLSVSLPCEQQSCGRRAVAGCTRRHHALPCHSCGGLRAGLGHARVTQPAPSPHHATCSGRGGCWLASHAALPINLTATSTV